MPRLPHFPEIVKMEPVYRPVRDNLFVRQQL